MIRERRPPSRHAKDCFGGGSLGSHRAESGSLREPERGRRRGGFLCGARRRFELKGADSDSDEVLVWLNPFRSGSSSGIHSLMVC